MSTHEQTMLPIHGDDLSNAALVPTTEGNQPSQSLAGDMGARMLRAGWLGLATDHRRLFAACQEGWFAATPRRWLCSRLPAVRAGIARVVR